MADPAHDAKCNHRQLISGRPRTWSPELKTPGLFYTTFLASKTIKGAVSQVIDTNLIRKMLPEVWIMRRHI
jgi:hypothetical protein